jgi:hypothetical protein
MNDDIETPVERVQELLRRIVTDKSQPYPPLLRSEASNALYDIREFEAEVEKLRAIEIAAREYVFGEPTPPGAYDRLRAALAGEKDR